MSTVEPLPHSEEKMQNRPTPHPDRWRGERVARAALTRVIEPSDLAGLALIRVAGPTAALSIIEGKTAADEYLERGIADILAEAGASTAWPGLATAKARWSPRLSDLAPERDLEVIRRLGGGLLIPEDELWPESLSDLGMLEPMALWYRGVLPRLPSVRRCIAVVGSRDSTSYGASVTGDVANGLVQRGFTVISGGAYGIDATAHRAALAAQATGAFSEEHDAPPSTIAVMAGGLDRYYPVGNEDLLRTVASQGILLSEVPPGSSPTRYRFLQRNRIIAALCAVTVVVEARWRSGALSTAHDAESLGRAVAAVPGSVYSANSAGCHRLLREGAAVCVTDAAEVAELAAPIGDHLTKDGSAPRLEQDGLTVEDLMLMDALPLNSTTSVGKLCSVAGLSLASVLAGLGRLDALGLAEQREGLWKRRRP
jgi:DNA processing protein